MKVSKYLKFENPNFFRFPDNRLDEIPIIKIIKIIEDKIKSFKPSIIFTHSLYDLNIDHSITCKAVLTATRPFSKTFVKKIFSFEIPSNTELYFKGNKNYFVPNLFSDISTVMKIKLKFIKLYKDELRKPPHPRSIDGIKTLAKYRASQCGLQLAEAFETQREFL